MRLALALLLLSSTSLAQEDLSLADLASLEREEKLALAAVEAAHGNRPPQQLSADERAQLIHEQQAASRAVFERHSVDSKVFAHRQMKLSPGERAQVDAEKARLDKAEADRLAREEAARNAPPEELEVTRGIDEKHPVDLVREPGAVVVENLQEGEGPTPQPSPAKPQKPQKGHKPSRAPAPQKSSRAHKSRHK
ncbi:MAG TPA: hypothetical protein VND93_31005 [Myxococcales bacterium]|nr:hypothetical protein [Myxococcales bacterium]